MPAWATVATRMAARVSAVRVMAHSIVRDLRGGESGLRERLSRVNEASPHLFVGRDLLGFASQQERQVVSGPSCCLVGVAGVILTRKAVAVPLTAGDL